MTPLPSVLFLLLGTVPCGARDLYRDVASLRAANAEGKDFRVDWRDRRSTVAVFAVHGGEIEPGTSEAARAIAGEDWSYYLFEALKPSPRRPHELHVTSTRFTDGPAVALARGAETAVSVHGAFDAGEKVCLGGANAPLRASVAAALARSGFRVEEPCRRLGGGSRRNIANRARAGGIQLELSEGLRAGLRRERALLGRFAAAVREGLRAR